MGKVLRRIFYDVFLRILEHRSVSLYWIHWPISLIISSRAATSCFGSSEESGYMLAQCAVPGNKHYTCSKHRIALHYNTLQIRHSAVSGQKGNVFNRGGISKIFLQWEVKMVYPQDVIHSCFGELSCKWRMLARCFPWTSYKTIFSTSGDDAILKIPCARIDELSPKWRM